MLFHFQSLGGFLAFNIAAVPVCYVGFPLFCCSLLYVVSDGRDIFCKALTRSSDLVHSDSSLGLWKPRHLHECSFLRGEWTGASDGWHFLH